MSVIRRQRNQQVRIDPRIDVRYFLDSEFSEDGRTIELISLALVCEDGREYYAISKEFDPDKCNSWVKEHVLPRLNDQCPAGIEDKTVTWSSRKTMAMTISQFVRPHRPFSISGNGDRSAICSQCGSSILEGPPLAGSGNKHWYTKTSCSGGKYDRSSGECTKAPVPEFWAFFADYDWVTLCQLYGRMIDLPDGWPKMCMDIEQFRRMINFDRSKLPPDPPGEHNALVDARWARSAHGILLLAAR